MKIEGFTCQRGLTGNRSSIKRNIKNLVLKDEVIRAVENGSFHIWAGSTVDEGIEILTGVEAGRLTPDGTYPSGTVNYLVDARLREMADTIRSFGRGDSVKDSEAAAARE